ncbi:MAG: hypothetical protein ACE37F_13825 [Nannocystaceae bacterium]|nr:hypothetical protein [bacterium]
MAGTFRSEAHFWWRSFWGPCKKAFVVCLVGFFLLSVADAVAASDADAWLAVPVVALVGGAYIGVFVAPAVGLTVLVWRLVGGWIIVPLVLIPVGVGLALWGMSGVIEGRGDALWAAVEAAASEQEWKVLALGPAARAGPLILFIALPLLVLDLGTLLLTPSVVLQLLALVGTVLLAAVVGAIVPTLVSTVVLSFSFVRRFKARHADA